MQRPTTACTGKVLVAIIAAMAFSAVFVALGGAYLPLSEETACPVIPLPLKGPFTLEFESDP